MLSISTYATKEVNAGLNKGDGVAEDQHKQSADGPAAADEIQTKNKKYDTQRKHFCFFHDKEKGVMFFPNLP